MTSAQARKGASAELELAKLLSDQLGVRVRRKLGAGRSDDEGDLEGLDGWTIEVKNFADVLLAIRRGLADLEREQANAGTPFGVLFVRRRGGQWLAVQSVEQWCAMWREATG